ncbi:type II toxin-antitoxin system VapB family antitoxin [Halomonas sp.]|uniref:type II toxin-antitoxin system VapB family antitoxin n=1 Tax=Halomonas sp. TaxID=1486246 RepID=UPI00298D85AD|nr:type II toxin-antitoxin system VapB family antitoxin [Halomonas sp.]MDW7748258.1 type II toxin-antitoxin system VapB family antitoxin [Halomonas sp.]
MRFTVTINDELYQQAMELSDPRIEKPADLIHEAIKTYVRIQAARRLSALDGEASSMKDIPRRK